MTNREWNLVKEAVACTRHQLGDRVAPGSQDAHRWPAGPSGPGVTDGEAAEIRSYVRDRLAQPRRTA